LNGVIRKDDFYLLTSIDLDDGQAHLKSNRLIAVLCVLLFLHKISSVVFE